MEHLPRLYVDHAAWWPLLSRPEDYAEEAAAYLAILRGAVTGPLYEVLELGSGGGNNASHLKHDLHLTLVDLSPGMLAVSRELNPECEHAQGDMRGVRLGRTFDAVFLHDALTYLTTRTDLHQAMATAFGHLRPGGAALFVPDYVRDTFRTGTDHGGHDGADRALRYLEWCWDPDPGDDTYVVDFTYVMRDGEDVSVAYDRHVEGLFSRDVWLDLLRETGFEPHVVPIRFSDVEHETIAFVARKPA